MQQTTDQKYYPYFDAIKILSALMVTFYHFSFYIMDYGMRQNQIYFPNLNRIAVSLCCASVPLFFMTGGALTLSKKRDYKYCLKKILKIVVLTLVWYFSGFPKWFFITLAGLYLVTPLLQYFLEKCPRLILLGFLLLLIFPFTYNYLVVLLKLFLPGNPTVQGLLSTGCFTSYALVYYLVGYWLIKKDIHTKKWISVILILSGLALNLLEVSFNVYVSGKMYDGVNASFPTWGALILSLGVFQLLREFQYGEKFTAFLRFVGKFVLSIYLCHILVITTLGKLITLPHVNALIALGMTLLIDALCVLIGWLLSKIPYVRELVKI